MIEYATEEQNYQESNMIFELFKIIYVPYLNRLNSTSNFTKRIETKRNVNLQTRFLYY